MVLKCQQFKNNESDATKSKSSKRPKVDVYENKKRQGSDVYQSKSSRYIPLLFLPQKELNCSTNLGEGIRSINYLV